MSRCENHCDLVVDDIVLKSGSGLGVLKAAAKLPAPTGCSTSRTRSTR
jgi:hypothetical protein